MAVVNDILGLKTLIGVFGKQGGKNQLDIVRSGNGSRYLCFQNVAGAAGHLERRECTDWMAATSKISVSLSVVLGLAQMKRAIDIILDMHMVSKMI